MAVNSSRFSVRLLACLKQAKSIRICRNRASYAAEEVPDIQSIAQDLRKCVGGVSTVWGGEHGRTVDVQSQGVENQDQLEARRMQESYQEAIIPLGSDVTRRQEYLNFFQMARIGKILEDLDILADWIAYLHIHGGRKNLIGPSPHTVVTALVDRIDIYDRKILTDQDIKMSGHVSWVGKSSMEVTMKMSQLKQDGPKHLLDACFLMVSRNVGNARASIVNPLKPTDEEEQLIFNKGEENHRKRLLRSQAALSKMAPTAEESRVIHETFMQATSGESSSGDSGVFMEDAVLKSVSICNPQQRNSHNKVFGGYLMRKAYELSWANACLFCKKCPTFLAMDDIMFRKPVEIGSVLEFTSQVVYTPEKPTNHFQIMTIAEVIQPGTGEVSQRDFPSPLHSVTNVFYFTFNSQGGVKSIIPRTYADAMRYLEGKRRYERSGMSPVSTSTQ